MGDDDNDGDRDGDGNDCQDKHQECTNWSNVGECDANPLFMLSTCCLSCHHRPGPGQAGTEEVVPTSASTSSDSDSGTPNNNVVDENDDDYGDDYDYGDDDDSFSPGTPSTTDSTPTTVNNGGS